MIKRDGSYCKCWESRLPKPRKTSVRASPVGEDIARFCEGLDSFRPSKEVSKLELMQRLKSAGLEPYEVQILIDRYFSQYTWDQVLEVRGWTSRRTAQRVLQRVLGKLKKRGFDLT